MTIIAGFVPREEGHAALRLAAEEAKLRDCKLIVVAVGNIGEHQTPQSRAYHQESVEQSKLKLEQGLTDADPFLQGAGVSYETRAVVTSEIPADVLIELATHESAQFIVIGLRRRSAVGKLVFGSNAQRILINASCPVIAVHPHDRD